MTDEEKAREYIINKHKIDMSKQPFDFVLECEFADDYEDFLSGLAEGRKETTEKISALKKENAELKEDLQTAIVANQQWLKRDTRLEEQIEKMKCCGNCKHSFSNDIGCMQRARNKHCDNLKLWEPVE